MRLDDVSFLVHSPVVDGELTKLHRKALGGREKGVIPWQQRLSCHSVTWVQAVAAARLIGFVNVSGDGGKHAFLLDAVVDPEHQHHGIGAELVRRAARGARDAACRWLHVDFDARLAHFYLQACGFRRTDAGLMRLTG